jgi:hypothetical protein
MIVAKIKAILYTIVGLIHIFFWRYLPNPVLASVIAVACFALAFVNLEKWAKQKP